MEYMGSKEYWDEKFVNRSNNPLRAEDSLIENIKCFKKGSVLDIACGDGRNSLFLLENNFKVTGIDFSERALQRLEMFAEESKYSVETKQIDLSIPNCFDNIGVFDNVLINHYRLRKEQLADIKNHISDNGILFVCGFGHKHEIGAKIRKDDLIQPTDFKEVYNSFELIEYLENKDDRGFFVTYIFRRK